MFVNATIVQLNLIEICRVYLLIDCVCYYFKNDKKKIIINVNRRVASKRIIKKKKDYYCEINALTFFF